MRDNKDTKTLELPSVPKKRGRPVTGKSLTPAQRKQRQRAKDWMITANGVGTMDFKAMTTTGLLEQLASSVATHNHDLAKSLAAELVKRSKPDAVKNVTVTKKVSVQPSKQKPVTVTKKKTISTAESMRNREAELKKRISQAKPKQSSLL
jgi:hypothetical protein